jgi:hypothetical protein
MVRIIRESNRILAKGGHVIDLLQKLKVTDSTHDRWRKYFSGLKVEGAKNG